MSKSGPSWGLVAVSAAAGLASVVSSTPFDSLFPSDESAQGTLDGLGLQNPSTSPSESFNGEPAASETAQPQQSGKPNSGKPQPGKTQQPANNNNSSGSTSKPSNPQATKTPQPTQPSQTQNPGGGTATQPAGVSGIFDGSVEVARSDYGSVQVQIQVTNGKLTDVGFLRLPDKDGESRQIGQQAAPWLRDQAIKAKGANIAGVSGATYTTRAFIKSLQSALAKAGI